MERPTALTANDKGQPLLLTLQMRDSETAPGRMKVTMTLDRSKGLTVVASPPGGKLQLLAVKDMPKLPEDAPDILGICPEFRLEMN